MTTSTLPPDLITVPEAAKRLGISEAAARRQIQKGTFPPVAVHIGRQWRISVPRLERWLHGDTSPDTASSSSVASGTPGPVVPTAAGPGNVDGGAS